MTAYYNEIEPAAAHVLEALIEDDVIARGVVDRRSIADVEPSDLVGFDQVHLFAGGGLWSVAARLAGWPDHRSLWTGSCPCQPFSAAGKGLAHEDRRHLWPHMRRLVAACRPPVVVGEQVTGKAGYGWFDGVQSDLKREDYACRAVDLPAACVGAPQLRQRLFWCALADSDGRRCGGGPEASQRRPEQRIAAERTGFWDDYEWLLCADGKTRRIKPGLYLLADGVPGRVGLIRIAGNAIVPPLATIVLETLMEVL